MFQHILVPLDGSGFSEKALAYALSLADHYHSELTLVQVIMPAQWMSMLEAETPEMVDRIRLANESKATAYMKDKVTSLKERGYVVSAEVRESEPIAEAILNTAQANGVDMIVMSTHGRSGINRWVFGSVAERVVRYADMPVLLVRPEREA